MVARAVHATQRDLLHRRYGVRGMLEADSRILVEREDLPLQIVPVGLPPFDRGSGYPQGLHRQVK